MRTDSDDDIEFGPRKPGWIKKDGLADVYSDLFDFFVINTPIENLSDKAKPLIDYGWPKNVWQKTNIKERLFSASSTFMKSDLIAVPKCSDLKRKFLANGLSKGFQKNRSQERVVFYNSDDNIFMSLFFHIRNAFAHGRYQIYDDVFVFEGAKILKNDEGKVRIRARGILKVSTLRAWINTITSGPQGI